jgi:hypothetical protein
VTDPHRLQADIFVDEQLPPEQQDLIAGALAMPGFSVRVRIMPPRRAASDLQWLVLAVLPVQAFLSGIGTEIANHAYERFQEAVRTLLRRKHPDQPGATRPVVLQDATTGLRIVLEPDLPADGYRQLLTLDLSPFRLGPLHYDRAKHRWRSELDEATAAEHTHGGLGQAIFAEITTGWSRR